MASPKPGAPASPAAPARVAGDDFDPHAHRKVDNPTSYGETMTHMLKGTFGAGMLAIPNAFSRLGLIYGFIGICFLGFFATYCIQLLILAQYEICKQQRAGYLSFPETMRIAILRGPAAFRCSANFFAIITDVLLILWQFGVCAVFLVFVSENVKQFLTFCGTPGVSLRLLICCLYPPLVAVGMIKDLKVLAPLSTFSNGCNALGLVLVFFYLIEDDIQVDADDFKLKSIMDIPVFIGTVLFAMEAVGVMLALEFNMEHPKEFVGLCGLFSIGMSVITLIYTVLGIFGYLKYGDEVKASITLNLPESQKKAQAAKLAFAATIATSYPLQNFVAWQILLGIFEKKYPQDRRKVDLSLRVICTSVPFLMAVAAPTLGPFIGLLGSLCLSTLAVLFPAVMDLCAYYPDRYGPASWKLLSDIVIIVLGFICCISGCYTSIQEMMEMLGEK